MNYIKNETEVGCWTCSAAAGEEGEALAKALLTFYRSTGRQDVIGPVLIMNWKGSLKV